MAVHLLAEGIIRSTVLCIICLRNVPLSEVTAGSLYADGHQAFACTIHLHDRTCWITEWAIFCALQRQQQQFALLAEEFA